MKVLVCCEESQAVCKEYRLHGHEAYSCDLQECSGGHPEWHIQGDALALINGRCSFTTQDGKKHRIDGKWDLLIAHPPCTYLSKVGNRWFNVQRYGAKALERIIEREQARVFFMAFVNADCDHIAIENPVGYMSTTYRKPDQIIQPYWFGDDARKATCLWLKGLKPLEATDMVTPTLVTYSTGKTDSKWYADTLHLPKAERAKARSKTFLGVARAMATQWAIA